jgi:ABC-2 type transport system ATP-binding protein
MIRVTSLSLKSGKTVLLDGVSFEAASGEVFGVVGNERSGKTELLRALAGLARPTSGEVEIAGVSVGHHPEQARKLVGYLAADAGFYPDMTCAEYLAFFAECYGVAPDARPALVRDLLSLVDLQRQASAPIGQMTRAMGQRLGIARILAHDPPALLLDEPTRGMDPRAHVETRELLRELAGMGKTVIVTAQNWAQLNGLAMSGMGLVAGKMTASGPVSELAARFAPYRTIAIRALGDTAHALEVIRAHPHVLEAWDAGSAPAQTTSAQSLMRDLRARFTGSYQEANTLLTDLLRTDAQVVAFHEI